VRRFHDLAWVCAAALSAAGTIAAVGCNSSASLGPGDASGGGGGGASTSSSSSSSSMGGSGGIDLGSSSSSSGEVVCGQSIPDNDQDGYTEEQGDCNDCDSSVNPDAVEGPTVGIERGPLPLVPMRGKLDFRGPYVLQSSQKWLAPWLGCR
jgi:hypothetical protein